MRGTTKLRKYSVVRPRWANRRQKVLRTSTDEKILANRSRDKPFDSLAMSRATQKQGGSISIGLVLSRESGRRAHQMRARCLDYIPREIMPTTRIPIFKPLPASKISLRLYETMRLLSSTKSVFELEVDAPYVAGSLVGFTTKQDPGVQRLQHKFLHALAIGASVDGEGNPTAYLLNPKITIAKFPLGAREFVQCLERAKEEYQVGIYPFTVTALCFRYTPERRGNLKWNPHNISQQWINFPLLDAEKVETAYQVKEDIKKGLRAKKRIERMRETVYRVIIPERPPPEPEKQAVIPAGLVCDLARYLSISEPEASAAANLPPKRHWYVKGRRDSDPEDGNQDQQQVTSSFPIEGLPSS